MSGIVGHILILIAFVSCILSVFAFYQATERKHHGQTFYRLGKTLWGVMTVCLFSAWLLLIVLIATHQFQYNYVWAHSSRDLPFHFLFSASWEGQEGSFLLWIIMNCLMGFALIRWAAPDYKAPVMTVVAFCQAFLLMMIVGIRLGSIEIGAAPFATLVEANPDAPIFQSNPDFVPADGTGLNDLLQNYWMVIHPPMLFVGFTTMIAPFAFAVVALWKRRYTQWVRPALPWTLISVMCLGIGIAMGGYWAYETLNFGGYWAWDPVENSSFVPWLVGIAAVHLMLIQRKGGIGHKAALFLSILAYILVVYSTFLTRSGILGDASVHAFVDLGLYNQLLIWILAMGLLGFGLFVWRYRDLPAAQQEAHFLSREFLVFSGAVLLVVIAAVVILGTSAPIFGKLFNNNPATVSIDFYNEWTLPITVGILFLAGLGQLFWWTKMNIQKINRVLIWPVLLATFSTVIVLILTPFAAETVLEGQTFWQRHGYGIQLMLLLFMAFFAFYGNFSVLWRIGRGNLKLAGGALAHVGLGVMVIGIIASSGFSRAISDAPRGSDRDNFVVEQGQPTRVAGYEVSYIGTEPGERGHTRFVLDFTDPSGQSFRLKPVAYESSTGQWIQHPDLKPYFEKDVYVAVTPRQMLDNGDLENELVLRRGQSTLINNGAYQVTFIGFDTRVDLQSVLSEKEVARTEIAVGAVLQVVEVSTNLIEEVIPIYVIRTDRSVNPIGARFGGIGYYFTGMNVDTGEITLSLDGATAADYVVVQAQEKPAISLVWIGIILLSGGFLLSASRRIIDLHWDASRG
ncbi:MAG: cytochrome C assembly protein [Rhodothermaceae bacterium]|nr:cytochrome C assembly protein [Rhodothermaceae bacterium]MXZ58629.1 cytochrome C assembly protein [Rhodothermaceae bacterium]MYB91008.1 cytochrome C assembly protein [Rhodothermaceae bacterium]MYD66942.1 cytochrome C assembly protein [Rhodothermaceae bacterium]MYG44803.1 cytochrome C assembly protein [Rhodothermaceae bacterium]